jgi:hypothetical protein
VTVFGDKNFSLEVLVMKMVNDSLQGYNRNLREILWLEVVLMTAK